MELSSSMSEFTEHITQPLSVDTSITFCWREFNRDTNEYRENEDSLKTKRKIPMVGSSTNAVKSGKLLKKSCICLFDAGWDWICSVERESVEEKSLSIPQIGMMMNKKKEKNKLDTQIYWKNDNMFSILTYQSIVR